MVIGGCVEPKSPSKYSAVWAWRQIDSLRTLGVEVEIYEFKNRRSVWGLLKGGIDIRRKVRLYNPDLVHVQYGAAQALITVLFSSKPVILKFGGSDLLGNYNAKGQKTWSGWLSVQLSRLAAVIAAGNIAVSEELRTALKFSLSRKKCWVIPDGIDLNIFKPAPKLEARNVLGWPHGDLVVLFMNRDGAWVKNPILAKDAFEKVKKVLPEARLQVIENEPPEKMPYFMNAADILLITSRHEGSNNTVKEALACNLPVVATPAGDIHQRLNGVDPSYVVSPDSGLLAQTMLEILQNRRRSNGRKFVNQLSLESIAKQVLEVYRETLKTSFK
ncbi:MAG: glycosyltransferase family 4 protein [Nitrospira sp.]|nr:glycosyltransferase family 4 protein [Nitrospira sp.]